MSNPGKKWDKIQDVVDPLSSCSKFKEVNANKLKPTEEELLKLNQKCTDLNMEGSTGDDLNNLSSFKLRSSLKESHFQSSEPVDLWKEQYELKPTASLTTISRTPVYCPMRKCGLNIGATSVLSHLLRDHKEELAVECLNLYSGGRSLLLFNRNMFNFGENVCLGVLAYGGVEDVFESRPALRGICKQNSFLSKAYAHLENHLPILIMMCMTSMAAMLEDKQLADKLIDPANKANHILVVWLVSVQTTKPVFCTITAFDEAMTSSRSTIVRVRSMEATQNPRDFLASDTNYLMMNQGELDILSDNGTKFVHVEIKIHEFDA